MLPAFTISGRFSFLRLALLALVFHALVCARAQTGSLDPSFTPYAASGLSSLWDPMTLLPNGNILLAGSILLNPDGSRALSYTNKLNPLLTITATASLPDGKILVGAGNRILRVSQAGEIDLTFDQTLRLTSSIMDFGAQVNTILAQADGKILFGGIFTSVNGRARYHVARLNADGTLDATFHPTLTGVAYPFVYALAQQADGKILFAGDFDHVAGKVRGGVARVGLDGVLDNGFAPVWQADGSVRALAIESNQNILVGSTFRNQIVRLSPTGVRDPDFNVAIGGKALPNWVYSIVALPNGKILIGGNFQTVNDEEHSELARLNPDGTIDSTFQLGIDIPFNYNGQAKLALQEDGNIVVFAQTWPTATVYRLIGDPGRPRISSASLEVGSSRVDLQACKLEYSIVSPK